MYIGGVDYKVQNYRREAVFEKGGRRYIELDIETINDDLVEDDEFYYLKIEPATLPDRVIPVNPSTCKIIIMNNDGTYVL